MLISILFFLLYRTNMCDGTAVVWVFNSADAIKFPFTINCFSFFFPRYFTSTLALSFLPTYFNRNPLILSFCTYFAFCYPLSYPFVFHWHYLLKFSSWNIMSLLSGAFVALYETSCRFLYGFRWLYVFRFLFRKFSSILHKLKYFRGKFAPYMYVPL